MCGVDLQGASLKFASVRRWRMTIRFALGMTLLFGVPVVGQSPYPQFPSTNNGRLNYPDADAPFGKEAPLDDKRLRQLNQERQKQIVSDAARLLQLARELNEEMTDDSPMTDSQLRKVAEIGKLARSVKERMSFTVGGYPGLKSPPNPRIQ